MPFRLDLPEIVCLIWLDFVPFRVKGGFRAPNDSLGPQNHRSVRAMLARNTSTMSSDGQPNDVKDKASFTKLSIHFTLRALGISW